MDKLIALRAIELFADLSERDLEDIDLKCAWLRYPKGRELISQSEDSTDIFFVAEGSVAAKGYSSEGKEVTYTEIIAGEMFGEFSAIDGKPRSAAIETLEDSHVARMRSSDFRDLVAAHPVVGLRLAEHLVQKNRMHTNRIFEFSTMDVRHRICAELLRMVGNDQHDGKMCTIKPAPSHYQIATRLSTHREAVSREFASLSSQGILEVGRQKIAVLDIPRLRRLTQIEV